MFLLDIRPGVSAKIFETETRHKTFGTKRSQKVTDCLHNGHSDEFPNILKFWIVFSIFGCCNSSIGEISISRDTTALFDTKQYMERLENVLKC